MINNKIQTELSKMGVWVCSYGGSGCNLLSNYLEHKGFICRTPFWHSTLCHYYTYIPTNTPTIYIYGNPINALKSQKFRNHLEININKLSNGVIQTVSDEALIYAMCCQFYNWNFYRNLNYKLLFLRYENLENSLDKLANFLNISIQDFPKIVSRKSNKINITHETILQDKYLRFIEHTNILD